jgi:dTDP-4-amino-4,6-dideoxygalactose transaminase
VVEPIYFNRPRMVGKELEHIREAVASGNTSGDGRFSKACAHFLEERLGVQRVMLTGSCTAALEIAALLCAFAPGDEVLMPSFTFPSTANAFVRAGARPIFVDIRPDTLNLDETALDAAVTPRTRAVVPVHYGGVSCEMDAILDFARVRELRVVEDAAQTIGSRYRGRGLGGLGDFGCLSFHETKNVHCGQGGALCLNRDADVARAEILRDRGTDRQRFLRGEVAHYSWVDVGSSFVLSEILCAYLYAQLETLDKIAGRRQRIWEWYERGLAPLAADGRLRLPIVPPECEPNHHIFFVILEDERTRDALVRHLHERAIHAVFHYMPLHRSPYAETLGPQPHLPVTEDLSGRLLRLPLYLDLDEDGVGRVVDAVDEFFEG